MRHVLPSMAMLVLCSLAAGCATPEYQAVERTCQLEWIGKIPPQIEQVLVNRKRSVQVPDGSMTCKTEGNTRTCTPGTRLEWIPYVEVATVDVNQDARSRAVTQCAEAACLQRYGNTACKK